MRVAALLVLVAACHSSGVAMMIGDDQVQPDASADAGSGSGSTDAPMVPLAGFGDLSGTGCGGLTNADLTGPAPRVLRIAFNFAAMYDDATDRGQLTPGGQHLQATPNAGGSSGLSETFAFEEVARCELATFLKSETEIVYDTQTKKTDMEVEIRGMKVGISVTRAFTYPLGTAYTLDAATALLQHKLGDIPASTASVSAGDRWVKQLLSIESFDRDAADLIEQAWNGLDPSLQGDTIVLDIETDGADDFIYTNQ